MSVRVTRFLVKVVLATKSDLLVINKVDIAPLVGASLDVMERDAKKMRGDPCFQQHEDGPGHTRDLSFHHRSRDVKSTIKFVGGEDQMKMLLLSLVLPLTAFAHPGHQHTDWIASLTHNPTVIVLCYLAWPSLERRCWPTSHDASER